MSTPAPDPASTRERLLAAAERLILARGFAATSVNEICGGARLTKGSFFHHFESKEALGCAVAERYGSRRRAAMRALPSQRLRDPRARLLGFLDAFIEHADDPVLADGCLLGSLGQEVSRASPEIRAVVERAFEAWAGHLAHELAAAKARHAPRARWSPESVARHFLAVFEGALILAKSGGGPDALRESLSHYRSYLTTLLGGKTRRKA